MEKSEINMCDNCFICNEYMGNFKNELTVVTGYSEKPIYQIFGNAILILIYGNKIKQCFFRNVYGFKNRRSSS
jgi:hypothetical protein